MRLSISRNIQKCVIKKFGEPINIGCATNV